jgi:methionine synthase I (cobalamin-dependent)
LFFLSDGAMGTELLRRGVPLASCLESQNVENPALVSAIHAEYVRAGAHILTANTFGANRFRLHRHGLDGQVAALNRAGVELARKTANGALVVGSVGPSGEQKPRPDPEALRDAFCQQAQALEESGVDLFSCETFGDVEEARAAVLGIRDVSEAPIFLQFTYKADGTTPLGLTPSEVIQATADLPIDAIGVNCAVGPETAEAVVKALAEATDLPLIAQPNAGQPVKGPNGWSYPLGPKEFAEMGRRLADHVTILGGCCGTTPEYIAALRAALAESACR